MGPEGNGVEPSCLAQLVQSVQVGVHVVSIVRVGWVVLEVPLAGRLHVLGRPPLWSALIINHVQAHYLQVSAWINTSAVIVPDEALWYRMRSTTGVRDTGRYFVSQECRKGVSLS